MLRGNFVLFGRTTHRPDLESAGLVPLSPSSAKQPLYSDYLKREEHYCVSFIMYVVKANMRLNSGQGYLS